jgi:hypothetical protein
MVLQKGSSLLLLFYLLLITGCREDHSLDNKYCNSDHKNYLFMGHTYYKPEAVDERIECLKLDCYDQIWLGGDVCTETTKEWATLEYLDNLFNLGASTTHWTVGNHDIRNGRVHWITEKTKRPTFYTRTFDGITLVVLNTNLQHDNLAIDTAQLNSQFEMIQNICDTIQQSSHLIILSHNQIWRGVQEISTTNCLANIDRSYLLLHFSPNKNFASHVYAMLQQVASRGVQIINIAGDFGQYQTEFEAMTSDGIFFLGSGITANIPWNEQFPTNGQTDKILVLHHDIAAREISWTFEPL